MTWLHDVATLAVALTPVLVLLGLGWGLRRARLLSDAGSDDLNRLCYWVLLPAHLFITIARCDLRSAFSVSALLAALIGLVVGFAVAWLFGAGLPPGERGSVISGVFRANAAYIGLPVIQLACAALPAERGALMLAAYPVLLAGMVPAFNIAAVVGFLLPRHGVTRASVLGACGEVARNPLVLACICGVMVAWSADGVDRLPVIAPTLSLLSGASVALALIVTGARLDLPLVRRRPVLLGATAAAKLLLVPAVTAAAGWALGAPIEALAAAVVLMASPAAVASVPMARQLGGDEALMAAIIVVTTVCAPLTMLVWLALLT